jgi:2-hydroxy-6-oxonona-2,4-dienedioate hydrolase
MEYKIRNVKGFRYIDEGEGEVLLLLHGLFGALSNFKAIIDEFSTRYRVVVPILPLFELEVVNSTIDGLMEYVESFIEYKELHKLNLLGNSLGGHISLLYTLKNQGKVNSLILTGSSGLFENSIGDSYPKKGDYEFVKAKTEYTFYHPETATKELIDEVYEIVNNREKAIRVLYIARSAIRHNVRDSLHTIVLPVKLIWGREDKITPLFAGEEFERILPNADLTILEECGHAPMMEYPQIFNQILDSFLSKHNQSK